MQISVIIPTFNESDNITKLIQYLLKECIHPNFSEIIVADGQSTDNTVQLAEKSGANVIISPKKGRAAQMNAGAEAATGDVLYFLHADSFPPRTFVTDIRRALAQGYGSGCYRLVFDTNHWFLRLNCWFTRFDFNSVRFGDQSLFVKKNWFFAASGFNEQLILLEDQEIIPRIKAVCRFVVLPKAVRTSARKYVENGVYRTQLIYFIIWTLYKLGYRQEMLVKTYKKLIWQNKV